MFSFESRQKNVAIQSRIRRLLDLTVPNLPLSDGLQTDRVEDRHNRVLPALLCAWEHQQPVADSFTFVVTKDIASEGVGLLLVQPFRAKEVLLAFCLEEEVMEEPWFFLGRSQSLRKVGAGFWTLGIQLTEFAGSGCHGKFANLSPLIDQLLPSATVTV
jgi:hypothetical protein